jgi:hypothetical protein
VIGLSHIAWHADGYLEARLWSSGSQSSSPPNLASMSVRRLPS